MSEHNLTEIPAECYDPDILKKLRVFDLSKNKLSSKDHIKLQPFHELKTLNLDDNALSSNGCLNDISLLQNLQNISLANNKLGQMVAAAPASVAKNAKKGAVNAPKSSPTPRDIQLLPKLPVTLKILNLSRNMFSSIPPSVVSKTLTKLEKLDLSYNQLATLPNEISNLLNLEELKLDYNMIITLPISVGLLTKLKVLSLEYNQLQVVKIGQDQKQQPIPKEVFENTKLIDLNLTGNRHLNNTLLNNEFDGFQTYLDRRQKVKNKLFSNLDTCGLE